jgi:hypothetical protein
VFLSRFSRLAHYLHKTYAKGGAAVERRNAQILIVATVVLIVVLSLAFALLQMR